MNEVLPPIVVVEGFDVIIHSSLADAEQWLEPWWVRGHEGTIYDAIGYRLDAIVEEKSGKVAITRPTASVCAAGELRSALVAYLQRSGKSRDETQLLKLPLDVLIQMTGKKGG
jgi:hypothetical protein